jgi:tetratricopeptide (TPR) repeat protein
MALGALDKASTMLEGARHEAAHHGLLFARLAWCRQEQGRREEAVELYQRSLALEPRIAVYHNLLRLYQESGRLEDFAVCLEAAWRFWANEQAHWPNELGQAHSRHLWDMQLELWLAREQVEAAEAWLESEREVLDEDDWCGLVRGFARRLAARDRHAQAEEWLRIGLARYPEHYALYSELAELVQLQGRPQQAISLLRRAVRIAQTQQQPTERLLTRLSTIALPSHVRVARVAAEHARDQLDSSSQQTPRSADELTELHLAIELALAGVEAKEEQYDAAERRYRSVLQQRPQAIPALQQLGQLLLQLGRIDEAVALFEQVKVVDPERGHGALIQVRRFPDDDGTLERLECLARAPTIEGSVRTAMLFQLAAAWDRRGDHTKAFALVEEANAASRRLLRYDAKAHRERCARIRHAFPKALFERRAHCGHESTVPVFVVGMPRSGTTLVEQIIAGHSRIHGAGELGTIPRVIAGLERWERHTGSARHYPDCADDLDPRVTRGIATGVLRELKESAPEADHVVDKLPHNFENIGLIKLLFPRAKIISVRRDPRDIAVSNYFTDFAGKHGGMGFAYDLDWIGEQLADHNLLMVHWQQVFPGEILEVRYEDVVDDPEASARRMLEYIGVDWEPQVLAFDALQRPVKTASVWQVRQPLYHGSKSRWRRYAAQLRPLIDAAERKIIWDPIEMVTLPEPGWLNTAVDRYREGDLDGAEFGFKQLLYHLPKHAAATFMVGLIYVRKGHTADGIVLMEQAVHRCPWNRHWRDDLERAYHLAGRARGALAEPIDDESAQAPRDCLDYLYLSGESTCSTSGSAPSRAEC